MYFKILNSNIPIDIGINVPIDNGEWVNVFDVVYQQFIITYMYDNGCQICCNWSRLNLSIQVLMCQYIKFPCTDNIL